MIDGILDGMVIRVFCKVKNLSIEIEKAWFQAVAIKYSQG